MSKSQESQSIARPMPDPAPASKPFWNGARQHKLMIPRCEACGQAWFPPSGRCPNCLSADHRWIQASGRGAVFSFAVVHRVYHRYFEGKTPYVIGVIELEEGPRLISNVVDIPPEQIRCNMPVEVVFEDVGDEFCLPKFRPASQR